MPNSSIHTIKNVNKTLQQNCPQNVSFSIELLSLEISKFQSVITTRASFK